MTVATQSINRAPRPSSLADVLEVVLDKGIVIDAYVRVAVVGIELLTIDARIVIASVDTYLRFAEAVNRLDLQPDGQVSGLPGLMEEITEGADRVVVLREGRTVAEFDHDEVSQDTLMHAMAHGDDESRSQQVGESESRGVESDSPPQSVAATPASLDEP